MKIGIAKAITLSANKKIGKAATTYASQASCPSDCVFMNAGCYAERGYVGIMLRNLNKEAVRVEATVLDVAEAEADALDTMDVIAGLPLRLHTVGDCATNEAARTVAAAAKRYVARGGGIPWTYSHAWRVVDRESWGIVSVLASCETLIDVAHAKARNYATALVVDEFEGKRRYTNGDVEIIPCPAQTKEGVTCSDCRLCFNDDRLIESGFTIGFAIHGDHVTKKRARVALSNG